MSTETHREAMDKIIKKLDTQLETAQTKVSSIQAHIAALKRIP